MATDAPRLPRAYGLGALAGAATALAYAALAEGLGLTFGLLAVGFFGGMLIGSTVARGAWRDQDHQTVHSVQGGALAIALLAWACGVILAFVVSQALLPQAATPLLERLSLDNSVRYFFGLDGVIQLVHLASLAAMAVMAWRGAR